MEIASAIDERPMQLLVAHQILIGSAIVLAAVFGVRAAVLFTRGGSSSDLYMALLSAAALVALTLYFRKVRARWRANQDNPLPRRNS
jgi:hypothetical protein